MGRSAPLARSGGTGVRPLEAMLAKPLYFLAPLLFIFSGFLFWARSFPVTYQSEARLLFGTVTVENAALPGITTAQQQLADTYSRLMTSSIPVAAVAKQTNLVPDYVRSHISATPIPNSPIIRVIATDPKAQDAKTLAAAAAKELQAYVNSVNDQTPAVAALSTQYKAAALALSKASSALADIDRQIATIDSILTRTGPGGAPPPSTLGPADQQAVDALRAKRIDADMNVNTAKLQSDSLQTLYLERLRLVGNGDTIQQITDASATGSTRGRNYQLALLGGAFFGIVAGLTTATVAANRSQQRLLALNGQGHYETEPQRAAPVPPEFWPAGSGRRTRLPGR